MLGSIIHVYNFLSKINSILISLGIFFDEVSLIGQEECHLSELRKLKFNSSIFVRIDDSIY